MVKVNIFGTEWKFYVHSGDTFTRKHGNEDAAFIVPYTKEGHFNEDDLELTIVKHEIWHAARNSLPTMSMNVTVEQEEELSADLFAEHGDKLNRISRALYKQLKDEIDGE